MENQPEGLARSGALRIREKLKSISGGNVLDVATGSGDFIDTLMKTLKDYDSFVGVDYSEKEVESARKRFADRPVKIMKINAEALEFENNSFDTASISNSLHHLRRVDEVLVEMKRVLKPNGYCIILECFSDGEQTEAQRTDILLHHWNAKIDTLLDSFTHNETLAKKKIMNVVDSLNLREVEVFESTHDVKCLFCEKRFECIDSKSSNMMHAAQTLKEIDNNLKKIAGHSDLEARKNLEEEGERLKERVKEFGISSASILFAVGKK